MEVIQIFTKHKRTTSCDVQSHLEYRKTALLVNKAALLISDAGCGAKRVTKYGFGGADVADPVHGTTSLAECCDACTAEIRCQYWTRRKDTGECYLKGDEGEDSFFVDAEYDSGTSRT